MGNSHSRSSEGKCSRRAALGALGAAAISMASPLRTVAAAEPATSPAPPKETYATQAKGIRIFPGQWRPHYPWEHIVWVSPSWPSQDYIWLDFPEAIFVGKNLVFLSHNSPDVDTDFSKLPKVPWETVPGGVAFERTLPGGISFGGRVIKGDGTTVDLELHMHNGSPEKLADITLQTCSFLRAIREFADYTRENKFVHVPDGGWIPMTKALELPDSNQPYRVGWRTKGKRVADVPMSIVPSNAGDRLFAFTWQEHTLSMIGNPHHPCMHADPRFPDLAPGEKASVAGKLIFFEGKLQDFDYAQYTGGRA